MDEAVEITAPGSAEGAEDAGDAPAPARAFAGVRLVGGLAVCALGAVGLQVFRTPEIAAFATLASISGCVIVGWGFVSTFTDKNSDQEDIVWASLFLGLMLLLGAGNFFFSRTGSPLAGVELSIAGVCFVGAYLVAAAYGWMIRRGHIEPHVARGKVLQAFLLMLVAVYLPVRWPLMALFSVGYFQETEFTEAEEKAADNTLKNMPGFILRWALAAGLNSQDSTLRRSTLSRAGGIEAISMNISSPQLMEMAQNEDDDSVRRMAFMLLYRRDRNLATATAMNLLADAAKTPGVWFDPFCRELALYTCSTKEFERLLARGEALRPAGGPRLPWVLAAWRARRFDLVYYAMRRPAGKSETFEDIAWEIGKPPQSHDDLALALLGEPDALLRADVFKLWHPNSGRDFQYDRHWQQLRPGAGAVFKKAFADKDPSVQRAACEKFIGCTQNAEALPASLKDLSTEANVRKTCSKLLPPPPKDDLE
jgi:hypothetical protein